MLRLENFTMLALVAGMLASCYPSTTIDNEWMSPQAMTQPPMRKVVTMFISKDTTLRHQGEDELARDLYKTGVQATPAYMIFGDSPKNLDLDTMKSQLRQMGYDGIVTLRVVEKEQDIQSVPGDFGGYWGYWGPYYGGYWGGYTYTEDIYRLEAAAYSLRDGRLMWSAITETTDPDTSHQLVDETSNVVAQQMARRGLSG